MIVLCNRIGKILGFHHIDIDSTVLLLSHKRRPFFNNFLSDEQSQTSLSLWCVIPDPQSIC